MPPLLQPGQRHLHLQRRGHPGWSGDDDDNVMMMMVMMKLRERPGGDSLVSVTSSGERTDPDYSILKIPEIFWWKISSFLTPPTGHFGFTMWTVWR